MRHWRAQDLPAPNVQMTVDPSGLPMLKGSSPLCTCTWDKALNTQAWRRGDRGRCGRVRRTC